MFKQLEDDQACIVVNGVYKVCDLYTTAEGYLFAHWGSNNFIRLKSNGSTSLNKGHIELLITDERLYKDKFGRLAVQKRSNNSAVTATEQKLLSSNDTD